MSLESIYEEYNNSRKEYIKLVEDLANNNLSDFNDETLKFLKGYKEKFGVLMEKASEIEINNENAINLKDLKYLILDTIFLSSDLMYFYELKEVERFKMRVINFINKQRRVEFGMK